MKNRRKATPKPLPSETAKAEKIAKAWETLRDAMPGAFTGDDLAALAHKPDRMPHNLGNVTSPDEQAKALHADAPPHKIESAARQALAALAGSGPRQTPPHSGTAVFLAEGFRLLRDHAVAGDGDAFKCLGDILHEAIADFHEVARRRPTLAAGWGRKRALVPVLAGHNIAHKDAVEAALNLFKVGEAGPPLISKRRGKQKSTTNGAVALAALIRQKLEPWRGAPSELPIADWQRKAGDLPPLNSYAAASKWAAVGFQLLKDSGFKFKSDGKSRCHVDVLSESIRWDKVKEAFESLASPPASP